MIERISLQQTATICCCNTDNCNETPYTAGVRTYNQQTDVSNGASAPPQATNANSNVAAGLNAPANSINAAASSAQSGDSGHGRMTDNQQKQQSTVTPRNGSSRPHTFTVAVLTVMWLLSR